MMRPKELATFVQYESFFYYIVKPNKNRLFILCIILKISCVSIRYAEKCCAKIDTLKEQTSAKSQIFGNYIISFAEVNFGLAKSYLP